MKEYKLVYLQANFLKDHEKAISKVEETINEYATKGWTLQQIVSHDTPGSILIGVFWREKEK